ncbi:MAG TPA: 2-dehydropantoate 2-reductase [Vicinamibacterales bacterium]|nr:2-dehydropantoate 2-reductase [Vicinamibacterales bacterium]
MRIAFFGSGGVGGYFGGRLAASGADVAFIARGAHLEALRTRGLRIVSPKGDVHVPRVAAAERPADIGPVDVVCFAVKMYDADAAAATLSPLVGPHTVVIPFQNGVESVDILSRHLPTANVAGGVAYITAVITEPGVIRHTVMDQVIFGEIDGRRSPRLEQLLELCLRAGFQARLSEHIRTDIWSKFVRLAAFSGMTAVTRSPVGVVREDPDLQAMSEAAWREGLEVARACGVTLPSTTIEEIRTMWMSMSPPAKSSMLEDLERGRRLELPWLSGAMVRLGDAHGVPTPVHRFIATVLKPHAHAAPATHRP